MIIQHLRHPISVEPGNRVELDAIDNVEIPAPREATAGHVSAGAKNDAPPPKPVPPPVQVEEVPMMHTMGVISISSNDAFEDLVKEQAAESHNASKK